MGMRYQPGQIYHFIRVEYKRGPEHYFEPMYLPWTDTLFSTNIVALKCTQHVKVSDVYDNNKIPGLDCDGFIFEQYDAEGKCIQVWHNQYPTACNSQTSDSNNWIVERAYPEGWTELSREEIAKIPIDELKRYCDEPYTDVKIYVDRILRGLENLEPGVELTALTKYREQVEEELFKHNILVYAEPLHLGGKVLANLLRSRIEFSN